MKEDRLKARTACIRVRDWLARKGTEVPKTANAFDIMNIYLQYHGIAPKNWSIPSCKRIWTTQMLREICNRNFPTLDPLPHLTESKIKDRRNWQGNARKSSRFVRGDNFLKSAEWRRLRYKVLVDRGARCECCGASANSGATINVDHIKPRKLFPELALEESNLQILCGACNQGKGNWDETDWRVFPKTQDPLSEEYASIMADKD